MTKPLVTFPLIWPKVANGPGRILEFSVGDVHKPENARQSLTGIDTAQGTNSVIVLRDWADQPSSGTHALDMSGGPSTTPAAAWYMITGMRTPLRNQDALAAAIDAYLRGIFHCGTFSPVFHHVGVSKTDPEMVMSVQGWPSREAAEEYWDSDIHWAFDPAVRDMMVIDFGPFKGGLKE
ncbi:hypothetical protein GE09DRAFT_1221834 [Coniochaeta sp. 2T2.1]|nr:hypothetical protein GE09DRAFT_1221834 [Coniochaeta sp. 2T2.1]